MGTACTHAHTNMRHSLCLTNTYTHTHKPKPHKRPHPDTTTGGNGLAKLNKCNHCDLNGRQSRSDVLKCALLFSLPFSINLSFLPLSHLVSVSCRGHPQNPTAAPPPFCFLLTTVSFSIFAFPSLHLPLMYLFFALLCLFLLLFDPCVKSVLGPASRSPCCYDRGLTAVRR